MKRVGVMLVLCMFLFGSGFVVAEEGVENYSSSEDESGGVITSSSDEDEVVENEEEFMTDWDGTCGDMDCDEVEITSSGINPDSSFYFIDKFFDNFGDEIANREERVAEIKSMVEEGNYEAAHKALESYKEDAENLEKESDPEKREEARRSAAAIKNALDEIRSDIPEEQQEDFYNGIIEKEKGILTAVDISSKIKELCVQLAGLDPMQYAKTCKDGDSNVPAWKKKLNDDLTKEQRDEAKKFGEIMSKCFKTSGKDCACEGISFYDFSVACAKAAPLATACDIDGDEDACYELDNLNMPELPDYLQDVLDDIESQYSESKYDMYMPPECVEIGITNSKECAKIMIKEHAPLECRAALLNADIGNEREGREICDKIMFEKNAPQECINKGITEPKECAKLMDSFIGSEGPGGFGSSGKNCMEIEDKMERLDCFENSVNGVGEQYGVGDKYKNTQGEITWQCKENRIHWPPDCARFMKEEWPEQEKMRKEEGKMKKEQEGDWRVKEKECAASCDLVNGWWDYRNGKCECYANEKGDYSNEGDYFNYDKGENSAGCDDCASKCPGASGTNCVNNRCVCLHEDASPQSSSGEGSSEPRDYDNSGEPPSISSSSGGEEGYEGPMDDYSTGGGESISSSESSSEPASSESENSEPAPMTGESVNEFELYWKTYR